MTGGRPWSVLGRSFGGFCAVTYLSYAPEGLREAFITGGLPGLHTTPDDLYRATYPMVATKNLAHYERYPQDVARAKQVARHLAGNATLLPSGARFTVEAFQSLGQVLGSSTGSQELHYLLEDPFAGGELSDDFLYQAESRLSFAAAPLYAILHEACYAQGAPTDWAAQRLRAEFGEFDAAAALHGDDPLLFTGEMIYPWMLENDPVLRLAGGWGGCGGAAALRGDAPLLFPGEMIYPWMLENDPVLRPLCAAADLLAQRPSWPRLYDAPRLRANDVPTAAAIYYDDMYVPLQYSAQTAATIRGLRAWVTNEYEHDGLRVSDGQVLDRLIAMVRGNA